MKTNRVLVVYGSETNQTKMAMTDVVDAWKEEKSSDFEVELLEGDKAAEKFEEINSSNYDFLLIGTSSYGEGDAPSGFGKFLYELQEAAKDTGKPLMGLQHAVLGFGSTSYETFQNCPRLVDKYLGEAGSRRCLKRLEIDEMEHDMEDVKKWAVEIRKTCVSVGVEGSKQDCVCDWTEPEDLILPKNMGSDGYEAGQGMPEFSAAKLVPIVIAIVGISYYFYTNKMKAEQES